MNSTAAISHINSIFNQYQAPGHASTPGKVYELYCLARTIEELRLRGFRFRFVGTSLGFKAGGGPVNQSFPYFELWLNNHSPKFRLWTDIQFWSLGSKINNLTDKKSGLHELDLVVVPEQTNGYPIVDDIALGVECKSNANFGKWILKQVLGVRREMSLLNGPFEAVLSTPNNYVEVRALPPSEFWLSFVDYEGLNYRHSAEQFGIEFKHWEP